jgi:hypothetical protein
MNKVYKARYIPNGKFYSKTTGRDTLTKDGKLYSRSRPQWSWLRFIMIDGKRTETQFSDWEIVVYELTEVGVESLQKKD